MNKEIKIIFLFLVFYVGQFFLNTYITKHKINVIYNRLEKRCTQDNAFVLRGNAYVCMPCEKCKKEER